MVLLAVPLLMGAGPFESADPDVQRGNRALREGKAEEALQAYEDAKARLGDDPRLSFNRGLAQAAAGELEAALGELQGAAAASDDPSLRARAAYATGNFQRKLKKYKEAVQAYRQALLEDPTHTGARRNLELTQAMQRIAKLNPNQNQDENQEKDESEDQEEPKDGGVEDSGPQDSGPRDAGPPDAGSSDGGGKNDGGEGRDGSEKDSGSSNDSKDAGGDEEDGGSSSDQSDAGPGQDAGANPSQPDEPQEALERQDVEQILDALQEQEKALERKRLMQKVRPGKVEKDW
jgi:tetratricopeptide (TPR) repeat protein